MRKAGIGHWEKCSVPAFLYIFSKNYADWVSMGKYREKK